MRKLKYDVSFWQMVNVAVANVKDEDGVKVVVEELKKKVNVATRYRQVDSEVKTELDELMTLVDRHK
jgi:tRNA(Ser,Leu) C12 N-acetylase TAN1